MPKVTGRGFSHLIPLGQMGPDGFDELTPPLASLAQGEGEVRFHILAHRGDQCHVSFPGQRLVSESVDKRFVGRDPPLESLNQVIQGVAVMGTGFGYSPTRAAAGYQSVGPGQLSARSVRLSGIECWP